MFEIDGKSIGEVHPPYIIAALSANYDGEIEAAKTAIQKTWESRTNAAKIQTYTLDTMTIKIDKAAFKIEEGLRIVKTLCVDVERGDPVGLDSIYNK